eukprot:tig00000076_g2356.t1
MWQAPEEAPLSMGLLALDETAFSGALAPLVSDVASGLAASGHAVHVFTPSAALRAGSASRRVDAGPPEDALSYTVHSVAFEDSPQEPRRLINACNALAYFAAAHEAAAGLFDAVHAFEWTTVGALLQLQAQGRRTVLTFTSLEPPEGPDARRRRVEAAGLAAADLVVLPSALLAAQAEAAGAPPYRIRVMGSRAPPPSPRLSAMPSPQAPPALPFDAGALKRELGFAPMDPLIFFGGVLDLPSGVGLLLDAVPLVLQGRGDARLVIVGWGPAEDEVAARAAAMPHAVRFLPGADAARRAALCRACDVRCVPAQAPEEGPLGPWALEAVAAVREAWAASKPVVLSDDAAGALAALAGAPLVRNEAPVTDAPSLAAALLRVFGDFQAARAAGAKGFARIAGAATPEAALTTCLAAYKELAVSAEFS